MELLVATSNRGKIRELQQWFSKETIQLKFLTDLNPAFPGDVEETGTTFIENACIKSLAYSNFSGRCTLSDDSGLCVRALGGAPGLYSARYAGKDATEEENNSLLLKNLEDQDDLSAYYICVLSLYLTFDQDLHRASTLADLQGLSIQQNPGGGIFILAEGIAEGFILREPRGSMGFAYDKHFWNTELKKTFGEVTNEEKVASHHRSKALLKILKFLQSYCNN